MKQLCHLLLLFFPLEERFYYIEEIARSLYRRGCTPSDYCRRYLARGLQFSVEEEDVCEAFLIIGVEHVCCRDARPLVHPHVEGSVETEGEATGLVVEMMRTDPEVGKQAVDMIYAVVAHPVVEITEVAPHKREIAGSLTDILLCILVLVEAKQPSRAVEAAEYLPAVASSSEGDIDIDASLTDVHAVNAFFQQYWDVIHFFLFLLFVWEGGVVLFDLVEEHHQPGQRESRAESRSERAGAGR